MTKPTAIGKQKYPPEGYYIANEPDGPACTCTPRCNYICKGKRCGCKACRQATADFGYE